MGRKLTVGWQFQFEKTGEQLNFQIIKDADFKDQLMNAKGGNGTLNWPQFTAEGLTAAHNNSYYYVTFTKILKYSTFYVKATFTSDAGRNLTTQTYYRNISVQVSCEYHPKSTVQH